MNIYSFVAALIACGIIALTTAWNVHRDHPHDLFAGLPLALLGVALVLAGPALLPVTGWVKRRLAERAPAGSDSVKGDAMNVSASEGKPTVTAPVASKADKPNFLMKSVPGTTEQKLKLTAYPAALGCLVGMGGFIVKLFNEDLGLATMEYAGALAFFATLLTFAVMAVETAFRLFTPGRRPTSDSSST